MTNFRLIATTAFGLETVVTRELHGLGYTDTSSHNGYVVFTGDDTAIARANLWLRTADRVLIEMGRFPASTFDALFEGTRALPWSEYLPENACFPVEGRSVKSQLHSVPACQSIVKKAIVEQLKQTYRRETFSENGPLYSVEVSLQADEALITLDTSGTALHKRGYRTGNVQAPIKETLAAALVLLSRWQGHRPFADVMCGSGTIVIEAALLERNLAPGRLRSFAAEEWDALDGDAFDDARGEADDVAQRDRELDIYAADIDGASLQLAQHHAALAGVADTIRFAKADAGKFHPSAEYGCLITNPPYGERLSSLAEVEQLYHALGRAMKRCPTWSSFVITSYPEFERLYGCRADKKRKLYNGRIQTQFYQYLGPLPPRNHQSNAAGV